MQGLSQVKALLIAILGCASLIAQSPHGPKLAIDCKVCHSALSWRYNSNYSRFSHDSTAFSLSGQHKVLDCRSCHSSLIFNEAPKQCNSCHTDVHQQTAGQDCKRCHNTSSWIVENIRQLHERTTFPLTGVHSSIDCAACHKSETNIRFNVPGLRCIDCHIKDYESTTKPNHKKNNFSENCTDCHNLTSFGWKTDKIDHSFFPLTNVHNIKDCAQCHKSSNYSDISKECIFCHDQDYNNASKPNHKAASFPNNCLECHNLVNPGWKTNLDHSFFPLTKAHDIQECSKCHRSTVFSDIKSECISCHESDYSSSLLPPHKKNNFPTDCKQCHTTDLGWKPATFDIHERFYVLKDAHKIIEKDCKKCHSNGYENTPNTCYGCHRTEYDNTNNPSHKAAQFSTDCITCHSEKEWKPANFNHDGQFFPIYSGKHKGVWTECKECHKNPSNYSEYSCISCHLNPETDDKHKNVGGYLYNDRACLACHPTGDADVKFDHNSTNFPLSGAHTVVNCLECHKNGYKGTPTQCAACHQMNYDDAKNPDHKKLGFTNDCAQCHTTQPDWKPASFTIHDNYYVLKGAHRIIQNDCNKCHQGNYNNTPNTCIGCHNSDYQNTKDPDHVKLGFSNDCATCHSESAWVPSTFDHDGQHFPIYSGKHKGTWNQCSECHTNGNDYKQFNCLACHLNPDTDQEHTGVKGYIYNNQACFACHPTGDADIKFDHNTTMFPLTGAHQTANCLDCHQNKFKGTSTICKDCHQTDFNNTKNPDHKKIGISTDCASCHNTNPGWAPASFNIHDNYYVLKGAHTRVAQDCKRCHNGDYNNTPNTCVGCHQMDYNNSKNPDHIAAQFPTDCASCHSESIWVPSTFDHDGKHFPVYSGKHKGEWSECKECHTNANNFKEFSCITCHKNPTTDDEHKGINGYSYNSLACLACHPTGDADIKFDHNNTMFPLTGAHQTASCLDCHKTKFKGTSSICYDCHQMLFDQSANPNHKTLGISTDCINCHTTAPGWAPAKFDVHDNYYVLDGAHAVIKSDCKTCHNGDYNNTPNTCVGCHQSNYNNSLNPNHTKLGISTDCAACHTTAAGWEPAKFDVHDNYYPLKGAHQKIANDCKRCHNGDYNNTPNTCVGCHQADYNNTKDPNHTLAQFPNDCASCHNENGWQPSTFPHDGMYFPIYTGPHKTLWSQCADCHSDPTDFKKYSCIVCHMKVETDDDHIGIGGYLYNDFACLGCHPTGEKKMAFNHNLSNFPLTGGHIGVDCKECHKNGFKGTPTDCKECHSNDYNLSVNPNHKVLNIPMDCASCHSTQPGWAPAKFDIHNNYWVLDGAHVSVDCKSCHNGNYNNTPNTCVGCHLKDYNGSTNPNHKLINIPTDCASCHTTKAGWSPAKFDIHNNYWVIDGAHVPVNCNQCHNGNYNNTPNTCVGCHLNDYNGSLNPNHKNLNLPKDCAMCHTTVPDWEPATFPIHDQFYVLQGAHALIKNNCATCHKGNYNNTPNTCYGCHKSDYDGTNNPPHKSAGFPTECTSCHSQNAWIPSTFNHDGMYFPIYSGKHKNEWNTCSQCHTNANNYKIFSCFACHPKNEMDSEHNGVQGYSYNSAACYSCHPDGKK